MVDIRLFEACLNALSETASVLLVGDPDQLPSVGPGSVLRDCIRSKAVPVARLETVHRQAEGSRHYPCVERDLSGQLPGSNTANGDFFTIRRDSVQRVLDALHDVVNERLPRLGYEPTSIQVLSPTRKGSLGTQRLNENLREWLNPSGEKLRRFGREYRVGDRIICTQNQHDLDVYNGDIGYITGFGRDGVMVDFEGRLVRWEFDDLRCLELGYAITIHKSQGSEYPVVLMVLHSAHGIMLQRNLMYTGTTRASDFCCYIGDERGWYRALENTSQGKRNTRLVERLTE